MAFISTDHRSFFGMDSTSWRGVVQQLLALPALRWVQPAVRVQLRHADGRFSVWDAANGVASPAHGPAETAPATAVELSSSRVLDRQLLLPPLALADLVQAVQLDVAGASPFSPEQTVYGFAVHPPDSSGVQRINVAITSRHEVGEALRLVGADVDVPPEVWVLPAGMSDAPLRPVLLRGYGEGRRQQMARKGLLARLGLVLLALVLLLALAVTPTLMVRQRALQAQQSFESLQRQAAPQLAEREAAMQRLERLQAVDKVLARQMALPPVLDMLTRAVPDGAWLNALRVEGNKLVLNGNADDAAALVQRLATQPGVHDVRLASPATRGFGATKETLIIEMQLDASRYGLARPAGAAS